MRLRIYSKPRKKTSTPEGSTRKIERSGPEFRGNYLSDVSDFLSRAANQRRIRRSTIGEMSERRASASWIRRAFTRGSIERLKVALGFSVRLLLILLTLTCKLLSCNIRYVCLKIKKELLFGP
jgi:hypothetical protein